MSIKSLFLKLWKKFGSIFRSGLDDFLATNIQRALEVAVAMLREQRWESTDAFARALWVRLRSEFSLEPGTWLTILASFAIEALKKRGQM